MTLSNNPKGFLTTDRANILSTRMASHNHLVALLLYGTRYGLPNLTPKQCVERLAKL